MIPRTMSQAGWREIEKIEYESLFNSPGHINGDIELKTFANSCLMRYARQDDPEAEEQFSAKPPANRR